MARVNTVLGPIDPSELGGTMSHVHLTLDISCWYAPPQDPEVARVAGKPLGLENLGLARRNGLVVRDNLVQSDVELTIREAREFKRAGGGALVDMELPGIGRDVAALARISRATGLHVIASTGWYTQASHPPEVAALDAGALADVMVREIGEGIGDSRVRAGNIGEIGCSGMPDTPCLPDEEKVLRAAARAQARTGASLTVHPNGGTHGSRETPKHHLDFYLDVLEAEGADLAKVYLSHMGFYSVEVALHVLRRGLGFVSYDHFGHEEYYEIVGPGRAFPRDKEEIDTVMRLLEAGHASRVLIGNEIGWKTCYKAYGGWGYAHVYDHVVPWLRDCGASEAQLDAMLVENPARLHAIA
ncbi:MAG: phosphotriesterase [Myxococcota bacterium]